MTGPEILNITSDDGENIQYAIHPHGAAEGFDLAPRIIGLLSGPANIIAALTTAVTTGTPRTLTDEDGGEGTPAALADEVGGMFGGIDGAKLSTAIKDFGQSIVAAGGHKLCLQILKYTSAVTSEGKGVKVGTLAGFEARYSANYGELFEALYHVVRVNFGPMIARLMKGQDPLAALGALAARATLK